VLYGATDLTAIKGLNNQKIEVTLVYSLGEVAKLTALQKNQLLTDIAEALVANTNNILAANENALDAAILDRLVLNPESI
jgi:gamma-glutamyl phosphate reductase